MRIVLDLPDSYSELILDVFADPDDRGVDVVKRKLTLLVAQAVAARKQADVGMLARSQVGEAFGMELSSTTTQSRRPARRPSDRPLRPS